MITNPENLTVAALWTNFAGAVLPDAPEFQRNEMRKAFIAGFLECMITMREGVALMPEGQGIQVLDRLFHEAKTSLGLE